MTQWIKYYTCLLNRYCKTNYYSTRLCLQNLWCTDDGKSCWSQPGAIHPMAPSSEIEEKMILTNYCVNVQYIIILNVLFYTDSRIVY